MPINIRKQLLLGSNFYKNSINVVKNRNFSFLSLKIFFTFASINEK